jgi:hypothetical protein
LKKLTIQLKIIQQGGGCQLARSNFTAYLLCMDLDARLCYRVQKYGSAAQFRAYA